MLRNSRESWVAVFAAATVSFVLAGCGGQSSTASDTSSVQGCAGAKALIDEWNGQMNQFAALSNPTQSDVDAVMSERSRIATEFGAIAAAGDPEHPDLAEAARSVHSDLTQPVAESNWALLSAGVVIACE
jgi:hypothetical protein